MTRLVAPPAVRWITETLEEAGFSTWAVGGAVRNALLDLPVGDWDLATRATPKEMRRLFRRTVPIGIDHGTVGILDDQGVMYEVTTFRRDVETDGRHAVVAFAERIDQDLSRRDFTVNAIAWHPLKDRIVDPYDGRADLERKLIRSVGDPWQRLREDYLRILRGMRFAGRFRFEIQEFTWNAMRELVGELTSLSAERVRDELFKVLEQHGDPRTSLRLYEESGALRVLYPELNALSSSGTDQWAGSDWEVALQSCVRLPRNRPGLRLAALLADVPPESAAALLVRLRLSNAETDRIARMASATPIPGPEATAAERRRWLSAHHEADVHAVARLQMVRAEAAGGAVTESVVEGWRALRDLMDADPPVSVADLAIDGRDLIAAGLKPGKHFGTLLDGLLDWVLEDPTRNTPEALLERALEEVATDE